MHGGWNQRWLPSSQIRCRRLRRTKAEWRVDAAAAPPGGQWRRPSPPDLAPSDPNPNLPNARPPPHPRGAQDSPRHLLPSPSRRRRHPPSTRRRRSHPSSPRSLLPVLVSPPLHLHTPRHRKGGQCRGKDGSAKICPPCPRERRWHADPSASVLWSC
uniref:Uncharacterized protein n=1 Tax=Oryza glaberrima TaxID=4538 RepID=I1PJ17_ORYGL